MNEIPEEEWGAVTPVVRLPQLDRLGEEGVNIQCIKSSDFVIGKQTNFNGPVTIISCADVLKQRLHEENEEKIVIRDPVLSQSAAKQMQKLAEEKQKPKEDGQQLRSQVVKKLVRVTMKLPSLFCLVIILAVIAVAVFYGVTATGEEPAKECLPLANFSCLYSQKFLSTAEPPITAAVYVVIYQTHDEFCYDKEKCKKISAKYRQRGKVECHFLVGGEGNVYEGFEWGRKNRSEGPTDILNICIMGNFSTDIPTYPQIMATRVIIQFGVEIGFISNNYVLTASNATTLGDHLASIYKIIKKYPPEKPKRNEMNCKSANVLANNQSHRGLCFSLLLKGKDQEMPPQHDRKACCLDAAEAHPPIEGDVNIQCLRSSEFVIGKQTNFNGCVTIISCVDAPAGEKTSIKNGAVNQEKIVIKDKVVSPSAADLQAKPTDDEGKFHLVFKRLSKFWMIPLFICLGLLVASVVAVVYLTTMPLEEPEIDNNNGTYKIYWKENWGGKPPKSTVEMKLPIPYVVISHTVTTLCYHLKACSLIIQNMQEYHLNLDFADIAYNFLVDSSGNIYEGRGWSKRNAKGGFVNGRNIDIALIGDFSDGIFPTEKMMEGLKYLLKLGVKTGKISQDYSLLASNSTYSTLSPGKNVYEIIMNWPHFDPDPTSHVKDYYD